ncbi:MAG: hypothetical protein COB93_06010 [Sneathiella sp.]|nr:MAG: hypothetical protein COB93_06010 [Sneathiella sp.]
MSGTEVIKFEDSAGSQEVAGVLNGRFRVDLSDPLNFLDKGENRAFRVTDMQNAEAKLFAITSNPYVPYRPELAHILKTAHVPGMLDLLDYGAVKFAETDIRQSFIFTMPEGGLVFNANEGPLAEQQILEVIVPLILQVMGSLEPIGAAHRGIRADNLFFVDEGRKQVILGESVTMPPGSDQPVVYEPLESANAHMFGRGNGSLGFDAYALGVLVVHLLGGKLPGQGLSAEELFTRKLQHGSFAALTEDVSLPPWANLLLTGLLQDDPHRRWDLETLGRWREIMHDRPKPGRGDRPALAPILFKEQEYHSSRLLAQAFSHDPKAAAGLLENDKLGNWFKNCLHDSDTADTLSHIRTTSIGASKGHKRNEITATTQIISLLDPEGSLWFRDVTFAWGGLGGLLAYAFMKDPGSLKNTLAELLENGLLLTVATNDEDWSVLKRRGWLSMSKASDCFEYMKSKAQLGFGLERCLYEMNPTVACLSSVLIGCDVRTLPQFIEIAEKKLLASQGKSNPFDRHGAAFIAAKSSGLRKYFSRLSNSSQGDVAHSIALLQMAAHLQKIYHPKPLPGFCLLMETLLTPLFGKIQSELRRELARKRYQSVRNSGDIGAILATVDLERQLNLDSQEYIRAIDEYVGAERLATQLQNAGEGRKMAASRYGHWIASVISISALATSMGLSGLYFFG